MSGVNGIFLSWYTGLFLSPKKIVPFLSVGRVSFLRELSSADIWVTYYFLKPCPVFHPQFCPLEWNHTSREMSIADCWETYYLTNKSPPPNHPTADCWDSSYSFRWNSLIQLIGVNFLVVDKPIHAQSSTYSRVRWSEIILQERCKFLTDGRTIINQLNPPPIYYLFVFETVLILSVGICLDNW